MGTHDGSYKLFFSHPRMVQDLLTGFVHARWVTELDFSSLQQIGTPGVTENLRRRESDVIWRVRWEHEQQSRFVYILIEFQSRPDQFMAVRLQTYVALLHENMIRDTQLTREGKLPPVLPLVLYNGERRWNVPGKLGELIAHLPQELRQYAPQLSYCLIDEMALSEQQIPGAGNLVGALIRLERSQRKEDLLPLVAQLERELRSPELRGLRRQFANWIHLVWPSRCPEIAVPVVTDLEEVWSMLAERFAQWGKEFRLEGREEGLREGRSKGRQEGRQSGQAAIVLRLLTRRFGELPANAIERVKQAPPELLERWSERLLDSPTLNDVFGA